MGIVKYKLWVSNGPGGGLFPAICGVLLIFCGGIALYRIIRDKVRVPFEARPFILAGAALVTALLVYVLGMIIPLGLFIIGWLRFAEKRPLRQSVLVGVGTATALFLIFQVMLKVPLPLGLFAKFR
jgi:hypothetical protein